VHCIAGYHSALVYAVLGSGVVNTGVGFRENFWLWSMQARKVSLYSGLDDINEFEAELEAPDKWARRFRILRESEAASQASAEDSENGNANEQVDSAKSAIDDGTDQSAAEQVAGKETEASATAQQEYDGSPEPSEDGDTPETTGNKKSDAKSNAKDADEGSFGRGKRDAK
jgi:hypothetical protein